MKTVFSAENMTHNAELCHELIIMFPAFRWCVPLLCGMYSTVDLLPPLTKILCPPWLYGGERQSGRGFISILLFYCSLLGFNIGAKWHIKSENCSTDGCSGVIIEWQRVLSQNRVLLCYSILTTHARSTLSSSLFYSPNKFTCKVSLKDTS